MLNRRNFISYGLTFSGLAACSSNRPPARTVTGLPPDLRPVPNANYDAWVAGFRARAISSGISESVLSVGFRGTGFLPGVVTRDRNQTETTRTLEDYLSIAASDDRVRQGRAALSQHRATLNALEARYGVPAEVVTAIWGLESRYGTRRGQIPVVSATSTLAFDGRRGAFFERQLLAALRILQSGDIPASGLVGSWAGAMGHTQFIPTSYAAFAVDFDGDGRRDIWSEDPTDALASAAAYLRRNGWVRNLRWGGEIGQNPPDGRIIRPQPGGPSFSTTRNFRVIKTYNNSDAYAIGVGHLADRIAGGGPIVGSFPADEFGLIKSERQRLQAQLTRLGFDTDGTDGVIGPNTRAAISSFQRSRGLAESGLPSRELLNQLR